MLPLLVTLLATLEVDGGSPEPAVAPGPKVGLHAALELELGVLPSGFEPNGLDFMGTVHPIAGLEVGEDFGVELGPTFRFRVIDTPPDNRASDLGGVLRRADWDEPSDFGQILSSLRVGRDSSPFTLRATALRKKTLGLGHLVSRYSNQDNADYHPTGVTAVLSLGPVRTELFASDVLGARLFAGDLAWDLGRTFSANREVFDRYVLALEVAHDFALAGLPFRPDPTVERFVPPPVTLLQLEGSVTVFRSQALRALVLGGLGSRVGATADLGFVGGAAMDATVAEVGLSLKLEVRKQAGGFRQGFFGPGYELARFAELGFSGPGRALTQLPNSWSLYAELRLGIGTAASVDVAVEHFFPGRTDLDATVDLELLRGWLTAQGRVTVLGLGQVSRTQVAGGLKVRVLPALYFVAAAGTAFFPQPDGALVRGVFASAGAGVDIER